MCTYGLITCMLMTVYICIPVYMYICGCHACGPRAGVFRWWLGHVESTGTHFPTRLALQFSNAVSTMGKCHCSFLLYYLLFGVHHSMVINDPFQQLHTTDISFFTRLSEGNKELLLWQQSDLVNCQLKDCSSTSWNLLSHGWKKEPLYSKEWLCILKKTEEQLMTGFKSTYGDCVSFINSCVKH